MLRDVVGAYLDTVTEREFDAPLLALLAARGFTDVHFLHGAFEFGKDMIAKGFKAPGDDVGSGDPETWKLHQFAIQSKAGDMGAPGWRDVRPQMDEARLDGLAHPAFNNDLPRAGVLVMTGRLRGAAAVEAGSYREQEKRRGQPDFEIWDRETLLEWLVDAPEVGLAGTSDGPILALAGAIDVGTVTQAALERHSQSWLPPAPGSLTAKTTTDQDRLVQLRRGAVEAAVLINRLRRHGRIDLGAMVALMLLRAAWCHQFAEQTGDSELPQRSAMVTAAIRLFAGCATDLLDQVEPIVDSPQELLKSTRGSILRFATYPVVCSHVAEVLGLLALLEQESADDLAVARSSATRAASAVLALLTAQPGCAHPISDSFAVALIAPTLAVAGQDIAAAAEFLERVAVWVADRHDPAHNGIGLAPAHAEPFQEVSQLFSGPVIEGARRRSRSYLATVVVDLAAALPGRDTTYREIINEFAAVDIVPELLTADETRAQWRPDGPGAQLQTQVQYREDRSGHPAADHHQGRLLVPVWDAIALSSVVRNRHPASALHANPAATRTRS